MGASTNRTYIHSFMSSVHCISLRNANRLLVGLNVERDRFGWPLRGLIWFSLAIVGSYVAIALLAGYVQKTRS
jgi:hypothetical protein